ncbi:MAG: glycosyltransferase family 4 protein [Alphaproteobacteria bacterium]|nr:glycosyltransferase family 4 protein [Alphaproteobacteria bacterium]
MKILHVVRQFAPAIGGMEVYVRDMILNQQALGCDCEVLTLNKVFQKDSGELASEETLNGIKIHRVGFRGKKNYFIPFVAPSFLKEYDIIHVHNTDVFFDYLGLVCRILKIPAFATTHGGFFHTQNFSLIKKIYFNTITRFSAAHYRAIFASSSNDYELFKTKSRKLLLTPNAITPLGDFIGSGNDFIYIGRLAQHKNIDQLIETFSMLVKDHNIKGNLHIVGPEWDVLRSTLKDQANRLTISDRIHIHGFIEQDEMHLILKQCGSFVSASSFEGFGMSMLEGMSVGLIPYVQPNGSFRDLINQGQIGRCVDFSIPEIAAQQISESIELVNNEKRNDAKAFADQFSWQELAAKTVNAYNAHSDKDSY